MLKFYDKEMYALQSYPAWRTRNETLMSGIDIKCKDKDYQIGMEIFTHNVAKVSSNFIDIIEITKQNKTSGCFHSEVMYSVVSTSLK